MRGALFDLDGTLIDSVADIGSAVNQALADHGLPTHPLDAYYDFVGEGVDALFDRAMAPRPRDPAVVEHYKQLYRQQMLVHTRVYPGVHALLRSLAADGWTVGVLSNKPDPATQALVTHFFGDIPWRHIAGNRPDWPRKPDPAAALHAAAALGVPPQRCWFVGDTAVDRETAARAGMRFAGVTWGFRPREVEGLQAPDATVHDSEALWTALQGDTLAVAPDVAPGRWQSPAKSVKV